MSFELKLEVCLAELKKSPFLVLTWKDEIIKSAKILKQIGESPEKIAEYLTRNYNILERLKGKDYDDLLEKPLAEIGLMIKKSAVEIKKEKTEKKIRERSRHAYF